MISDYLYVVIRRLYNFKYVIIFGKVFIRVLIKILFLKFWKFFGREK